jgi:hypothetical protein
MCKNVVLIIYLQHKIQQLLSATYTTVIGYLNANYIIYKDVHVGEISCRVHRLALAYVTIHYTCYFELPEVEFNIAQ